jgi:hypothetical protein
MKSRDQVKARGQHRQTGDTHLGSAAKLQAGLDLFDDAERGTWRVLKYLNTVYQQLKWCGEGDLNPHGITPASTSS